MVDLLSIILKIYNFLKDSDKNNYVCDVKYITTYTNTLPVGLRWLAKLKKIPRDAYFH